MIFQSSKIFVSLFIFLLMNMSSCSTSKKYYNQKILIAVKDSNGNKMTNIKVSAPAYPVSTKMTESITDSNGIAEFSFNWGPKRINFLVKQNGKTIGYIYYFPKYDKERLVTIKTIVGHRVEYSHDGKLLKKKKLGTTE